MQLIVRSQNNYVLDFKGSETFADLKNRIAEVEKSDEVLLYVAGRPLDLEADGVTVAALDGQAVDVNVPLLGGKVCSPQGSILRLLNF
jgi:hypothetical protein